MQLRPNKTITAHKKHDMVLKKHFNLYLNLKITTTPNITILKKKKKFMISNVFSSLFVPSPPPGNT